MMTNSKHYRPGEICPQSGLYRLIHTEPVSAAQEVIPLTKGERFPPCRNCKKNIEWVLVEEAKRDSQ